MASTILSLPSSTSSSSSLSITHNSETMMKFGTFSGYGVSKERRNCITRQSSMANCRILQLQSSSNSHFKKGFAFLFNAQVKHLHNIGRKEYCRQKQYKITAASHEHEHTVKAKDDGPRTFRRAVWKNLNAFFHFTRPYTLLGTIIGGTSISLLPVETIADISPSFLIGLLKALTPTLLINIYVAGINELFDIEIDKVNKPFLPLASGDFSIRTGITIVLICVLLSFGMGLMFQSPPLIYGIVAQFLVGSAYSVDLPLLRWKKHPFLAVVTVVILWGIALPLPFFLHMQRYILGKPIILTRSLVFTIAFMCFFSIIIALFKDLPDVEGDKEYGIESLSVRMGQKKVFWLCINSLLAAYGVAMVIGAFSVYQVSKIVSILGHGVLASILLFRARNIDISNSTQLLSFYMFIWKLLYAEYFLIPFIR